MLLWYYSYQSSVRLPFFVHVLVFRNVMSSHGVLVLAGKCALGYSATLSLSLAMEDHTTPSAA